MTSVTELTDQRCFGVRRECRQDELSRVIPSAATEVDEALGRAGVAPHDDLIVLYRHLVDTFELHIGRPAEGEPPDGLVCFALPAGPAVTKLHVGPYYELGPAWQELFDWCASERRKPVGLSWEIYHHLDDPEKPRTTVCVALERD